MTRSTVARALAAVVAVPVLVLAQGYLDVRAEANANNLVLDASTTRLLDITEASPTWLEALVTVVLAGALVALVLPGHDATAFRLLPLLVATALLAVVVVVGLVVVDPPYFVTYVEEGGPQPVWYWLRTGALSPVNPLLLGALLVLCARAGWIARAQAHPLGTAQP